MKKIFHFVKSNYITGVENVVINICKLIPGYDYTIVSPKGPINEYLRNCQIKHITVDKITPLNIFKVIKRYKPDIVQAHDLKVSLFLSLSYPLCKINHIKMISQLHNNTYKMRRWWGIRAISYALVSLLYNNIIIVSKDIGDNYPYEWLIKNKVSLIKNVINPLRIKKGLSKNSTKKWDCIFLGRMAYQKNPFRFVRIIKKLKRSFNDIKAVMVGNGVLLHQVKDLIKENKLTDNVLCVGFQNNPYKYLQESKILVMTSRYEGLPLSVLEALMVGDPVVSTSLYGLKNIINDSCGGFAYNDEDFIEKIIKLLIDNKYYLSESRGALYRINAINNTKKFIKDYKDIYQ